MRAILTFFDVDALPEIGNKEDKSKERSIIRGSSRAAKQKLVGMMKGIVSKKPAA